MAIKKYIFDSDKVASHNNSYSCVQEQLSKTPLMAAELLKEFWINKLFLQSQQQSLTGVPAPMLDVFCSY